MKISELASRTGTTPKTLRFYEDAGLLPTPERAANGYRTYHGSAITRVQFVKAGQAVGLTLAEIRDLMAIRDDGRAPCSAAMELLDAQLADITERIRDLQAMKKDLAALRARALDLDLADCTPESVCHVINPGPCTCQEHRESTRVAS
ncbi:MAG TPA: heavy metal-responsive transcriptional regulator [Acidimicrobiia bacterium]|nr:heavy metal-responsive transcriptional regulator [Acidimicrobiia bacterium]